MKKKKLFLLLWVLTLAAGLTGVSHAATITGKALFEGTAPTPENIKMGADPKCQLAHPNGLAGEEVVVNSNGTLKNVFIYAKEGLAGKTFDTPKEAVVFDQKGCQYTPRVFGIQANQPLEILNSDDTLHNVHSLSANNQQFNLGMPIKGMKLKKTFTKPEVMVKIKCDVHPWMHAYAGVLDHPFYSVSTDEGVFTLKNLPPGNYVIEAWHEKYGAQTQNVAIGSDADTKDIQFQYKG